MRNVGVKNKLKSIKDLKQHLHKYKDALIIIGPDAIKQLELKAPSYEELDNNFTRKSLRKTPEEFWEFYKKEVYTDTSKMELSDTQKAIMELNDKGLVSYVYNQNHDGLLAYKGMDNSIDHKGSMLSYTCQRRSCGVVYPNDYVMSFDEGIPKCEVCNTDIRPSILLSGENYNDDIFLELKERLLETHTLILLGIDIKEDAILNLIADYGDIKALDNQGVDQGIEDSKSRMIVTIQRPDLELDMNEVAFSEFLVKDDIGDATNRFLKAVLEDE